MSEPTPTLSHKLLLRQWLQIGAGLHSQLDQSYTHSWIRVTAGSESQLEQGCTHSWIRVTLTAGSGSSNTQGREGSAGTGGGGKG